MRSGIDVQPAEIITAINQGHVALMRLPRRLDFTTDITISENVLWQYEELVEPVEGSFVKSALEKFEKLAHDRTPEAIEVELRKELNSHMKDFQTQAPMITNYRRYVVIGVEEEAPAYAATYTWVCRSHCDAPPECLLTKHSASLQRCPHLTGHHRATIFLFTSAGFGPPFCSLSVVVLLFVLCFLRFSMLLYVIQF
jgi:hypothetical protein